MNGIWKWILEKYRRYREQINYLIVGGLTTAVSLGTYYLCTVTFLNPADPLQLQAANVISWICAVTFAYFTNRSFVFQSRDSNRLGEAFRFFASRVSTLLMEAGLMWVGVSALGVNDRIMKLLTQVAIIIANYVLSKLLVFRKKDRQD